MYPAPNMCRVRVGVASASHFTCPAETNRPHIHTGYALWAEHHNECSTCKHQSWLMPGGVYTVEDPEYADGSVMVVPKGERKERRVYFKKGADLSVLCDAGAELFKAWVAATIRG